MADGLLFAELPRAVAPPREVRRHAYGAQVPSELHRAIFQDGYRAGRAGQPDLEANQYGAVWIPEALLAAFNGYYGQGSPARRMNSACAELWRQGWVAGRKVRRAERRHG